MRVCVDVVVDRGDEHVRHTHTQGKDARAEIESPRAREYKDIESNAHKVLHTRARALLYDAFLVRFVVRFVVSFTFLVCLGA